MKAARNSSSALLWGLAFGILGLLLVGLNFTRSQEQAKMSFVTESKQTVELDQSRFVEVLRLLQEMLTLVADDPYTHAFVASGGTFPPSSQARIGPAFDFLSRRLDLWGLQIVSYVPEPRLFWSITAKQAPEVSLEQLPSLVNFDELREGQYLVIAPTQYGDAFFYCYPVVHNELVVGFVSLLLPKTQLVEGMSDTTQSLSHESSGLKVDNGSFGGGGSIFQESLKGPAGWVLSASRPDSDFGTREDIRAAKNFALFSLLGVIGALGFAGVWLNRRQVLEKSRAKSEFLATLSHEIRNPLGGILSINKLARDASKDPLQMEYLDMSSKAAESTLRLLQDTLEMSRIEAGTLTLRPTPIDVRQLLHDATKTLALEAEKKGVELVCAVSVKTPRTLSLDGPRLRQVVLNLLGNALKFTDSGSVTLETDWSDGTLLIRIHDTGCGISESDIKEVFEAYKQVGSGGQDGVGLGLHISHQIVEAFGSELKLESKIGQGTTFRFRLRPEVLDSTELDLPSDIKSHRLLLWASAPVRRDRLEKLLGAWGLDVDVLASPITSCDEDAILVADAEIQTSVYSGTSQKALIFSPLKGDDLPELPSHQKLLTRPASELSIARALSQLLGVEPVVSQRPTRPREGQSRILLAEDSPIHQRFTTRMLESAGYKVELAENGEQALEMAQSEGYDLLLLDVRMPLRTGLEVAEELRMKGSKLPIIGLTANAIGRDKERCLEAGMNRYLAKPYDEAELFAMLSELLPNPVPGESGTDEDSLFKPSKALAAVGGNPETLLSLTGFFVEQSPILIRDLEQSLEQTERFEQLCGLMRNLVTPFGADSVLKMLDKASTTKAVEDLSDLKSELNELRKQLLSFTQSERKAS